MSQGTKDFKLQGKKNQLNAIDLSGYAKPDAGKSVFQLLTDDYNLLPTFILYMAFLGNKNHLIPMVPSIVRTGEPCRTRTGRYSERPVDIVTEASRFQS